jgi:hypothetical protein
MPYPRPPAVHRHAFVSTIAFPTEPSALANIRKFTTVRPQGASTRRVGNPENTARGPSTLTVLNGRGFLISALIIDPDNRFSHVCKPYAEIPAWWSGFLFHVLNTRQLSLYLYLSMLSGESGVCHPTTKQIRQDLGLASLTIVFDAMSALENAGFILRQRRNIEMLNSRRNVYQRPACEFTILRLIRIGKIDGLLRPTPGYANEMSAESERLKRAWIDEALDADLADYRTSDDVARKTALLVGALERKLESANGDVRISESFRPHSRT